MAEETTTEETQVETPAQPAAEPKTETPAAPEKPDGKPAQDSPTIPMGRFTEVYRKGKEAERRAAELERENAELRQQKPVVKDSPAPPKWEEYEKQGKSAEEFNLDTVTFIAEQRARRIIEEERQREGQNRRQAEFDNRERQAGQNLKQKMVEARARYTDLDASIQAMADAGIQFDNIVALAIAESDNAADLAYHLAKNPETAFQLASMPVDKALFQLGRITSGLSKGNGSPVKPTKAPDPAEPVSSEGSSSYDDLTKLSQAEYNKRRNAQNR